MEMKLTGLDKYQHVDLRLQKIDSYEFANAWHSVSISADEIKRTALDYPVLFIKADNAFQPMALLSLVENHNQYVNEGKWDTSYIPVAIRSYPFRLVGEQVLIDEDAPHLTDSQGEALFTKDSQPTEVLKQALDSLRACYAAEEQSKQWCESLAKLDLLIEKQVEVMSPVGQSFRLDGFHIIDADKIDSLPDDELTRLVRDGSLARIHAHLLSLENLLVLAGRHDKAQIANNDANAKPTKPN